MTIDDLLKLLVDGSVSLVIMIYILYLHLTVLKDIQNNQTQMIKIISLLEDNIKDIQKGGENNVNYYR